MTLLERKMASILATLLNVPIDRISLNATFGEQGLDSLTGLRFVRELREISNMEIEVEWIFDYPTIHDLSTFLTKQNGSHFPSNL